MRPPKPKNAAPLRFVPLSREGLFWCGIASALLFTALLKSINLITLLSCWMAAIALLNFLWARRQIRAMQAQRQFLEPAFAQTPFRFLVKVENSSAKVRYGLNVHDHGLEHQQNLFIPAMPGRQGLTLPVTIEIPRRGRYVLDPLELTSGHPLGLAHVHRSMARGDELIVLPRLGILQRGALRRFLSQFSPSLGQAQAFPRRHPGAQTEFHGLRSFRAGDSPRWIHWRTTARRGELMVREFEDMPEDHLVLIVEPWIAAEKKSNDHPRLERLLSFAATIVWEWCRQKGDRLALAVAGQRPVITGSSGRDLALQMLECLALTGGCTQTKEDELLEGLWDAQLPPGPILVLSCRDSQLADAISQGLHRPVACIDIARGDDADFFELK